MTSRQPRTIPPGTTGGTGMLDDGSRPGGQRWPLQVLPLALLILLAWAAGGTGFAVWRFRWHG